MASSNSKPTPPTNSNPSPAPRHHAPHIAEALLSRAHPDAQTHTIFLERVHQRPLRLRATSPPAAQNARDQRQRARARAQNAQRPNRRAGEKLPLSAKEKRKRNIYEIPAAQRKFQIYLPLHRLWCAYMREILGVQPPPPSNAPTAAAAASPAPARTFIDAALAGPLLVTADYHGALLRVIRSRASSRVGLAGIVVRETKFTFELVTRTDELKVVPKEWTVFRVEVPFDDDDDDEGGEKGEAEQRTPRKPLVFDLYGSQFLCRAADRANRKFKMHLDLEL